VPSLLSTSRRTPLNRWALSAARGGRPATPPARPATASPGGRRPGRRRRASAARASRGGHLARQAGADAVEHRVAAGQHAHGSPRRASTGQRKRAWPAQPLAGHAARQQGQLARAADDPRAPAARAGPACPGH
jgi:hypothetical protein